MIVAVEDPGTPDVLSLLAIHRAFGDEHSPPEDVHQLDVSALRDPAVTFCTVRRDGELLAIGALKTLDAAQGELKSMHTAAAARRQGAGRLLVAHLIDLARSRGLTRLSLETGAMDAFAPARALYESFGFVGGPPFADYRASSYSTFLTLAL